MHLSQIDSATLTKTTGMNCFTMIRVNQYEHLDIASIVITPLFLVISRKWEKFESLGHGWVPHILKECYKNQRVLISSWTASFRCVTASGLSCPGTLQVL